MTSEGEMPKVEEIKSSRDGKMLFPKPEDKDKPITLVFDGANTDKKIVFEVLTGTDIPNRLENHITITYFKGSAIKLREELKKKHGDYVVGVFYDPIEGKGPVVESKLLRTQVREFVKWLKENKLID